MPSAAPPSPQRQGRLLAALRRRHFTLRLRATRTSTAASTPATRRTARSTLPHPPRAPSSRARSTSASPSAHAPLRTGATLRGGLRGLDIQPRGGAPVGKFKPRWARATAVGQRISSSNAPSHFAGAQPRRRHPARRRAGGGSWVRAGVFDGVVDGGSADTDVNDDKDAAARLWLSPEGHALRALRTVVRHRRSRGNHQGRRARRPCRPTAPPAISRFSPTAPTAPPPCTVIADGERLRVSPQAASTRAVGLLAEYVQSRNGVRRGDATDVPQHRACRSPASGYSPARTPPSAGTRRSTARPRPREAEKRGWGASR